MSGCEDSPRQGSLSDYKANGAQRPAAEDEAPASCQASPTGPDVVACPGDQPANVEIRSIQTGSCLAVLQPPDSEKFGMSMSLAFLKRQHQGSCTGSLLYLAVGYEDSRLAVWQLAGLPASVDCEKPLKLQHALMTAKLHNEPLMALAMDPSGTGGISGSAEKTAVCFQLDFDEKVVSPNKTTELANEGIADIAVRPDGRLFVTAGWDGRLRIYHRKKATCLVILKYHSAAATAVAFSSAKLMASAGRDNTVALWDLYR